MRDQDDISRILLAIKGNIADLSRAQLSPSFYYASLPLCVIDSVFSIRARYDPVVINVVNRWCESRSPAWKVHGRSESVSEHSIKDFLSQVAGIPYHDLADNVFKNRGRTSTRAGILKSEAVVRFCVALDQAAIDDFSDIQDDEKNKRGRHLVKQIPGQSSGITYDYFLMLAGSDEDIKIDTHLLNFVAHCLRRPLNQISRCEAKLLLLAAHKCLKEEFPDLTPRKLDHEIWKYQRSISQAQDR